MEMLSENLQQIEGATHGANFLLLLLTEPIRVFSWHLDFRALPAAVVQRAPVNVIISCGAIAPVLYVLLQGKNKD